MDDKMYSVEEVADLLGLHVRTVRGYIRAGRLNAVAAFWAAYVITRPLGASFADWMGVPTARAGLDQHGTSAGGDVSRL